MGSHSSFMASLILVLLGGASGFLFKFMTSLVLGSQHYFPLVEHVLSPCSVLRIIKTVDILT